MKNISLQGVKRQSNQLNLSNFAIRGLLYHAETGFDVTVYHLYNLTYKEAKVIDATLREEEFEKYNLPE